MPQQGPANFSTFASVLSVSDPDFQPESVAWSQPDHAEEQDSQEATAEDVPDDEYSEWLVATGPGVTIPSDATNIVMTVGVRAGATGGSGGLIIFRGVVGGIVSETGNVWGTGSLPSTLSSYVNLLAADLSSRGITPSQINASDFGVAIKLGNVTTQRDLDIDHIRATFTYDITPSDREASVTLQSSVIWWAKNVTLQSAVSQTKNADVMLVSAVGTGIVLTNPVSGQTVTTAAPLITWTHHPTVQADYRVRIYTDALETELVYDSGVVGSSLPQHQVPAGALPSGNLWIRVVTHDVNGVEGRTALVDFTTSFPTSVNVTTVTADSIGGCDAPLVLPGVRVRWSQIVPGGGETFIRYEVRRRKPGETAYTPIAHIEEVDTLRYDDHANVPAQVYEYAVVWVATSGASTLISAEQASPAREGVAFDFSFLHSIADPTKFVRLEHYEALVELMQPVDVFEPWGREAGTAYTGEQFSHQIAIPLHNQQRKKPQTWEKLLALARQQRTGDVLCLRIGRDRERYFCVMRRPRKQLRQKTYEPSIELVEVNYPEAVTE